MTGSWVSKFELKHPGSGKWCYVPSEEGRAVGVAVRREVEKVWSAPSYYFHLKKGGHVAAIQHHLSSASFLRLDLTNFFGSITATRITRSLRSKLGYTRAREIALLSTVSPPGAPGSRSLPYGFVQSPLLASVCLAESALGRQLQRISFDHDARVSVYVDDIIVSAKDSDRIASIKAKLEGAASRAGLTFNFVKSQGPAPEINAFNIELSHDAMRVSPTRFLEFQTRYRTDPDEQVRQALLAYVSSVNTQQADNM